MMTTQELVDVLTERVCKRLDEVIRISNNLAWRPIATTCVVQALRALIPDGDYTAYTFSDQEAKIDSESAKWIGLIPEEAKKAMQITYDALFESWDIFQSPVIISVNRKNYSLQMKKVMVAQPSP